MLPYFNITSLRSSFPLKEKKRHRQLRKLRALVESKPPVYPDDYWWKQFFEHSEWMAGAVPVEYRTWLEGFVKQHLPKESQKIYTEPSGRYMFIPWKFGMWSSNNVDLETIYHEMWKHGLIRSFQHGNDVTATLWGSDSSRGEDEEYTVDRLKYYTGIEWNDSPEQVRFYHFFQCAKGSRYPPIPTHTILGWTKKSQEYHSHEKKKDSVLRLRLHYPSYFIVEESFPAGLVRAKRQGFRGVFNPKQINFPNCVHRFTTSQLDWERSR